MNASCACKLLALTLIGHAPAYATEAPLIWSFSTGFTISCTPALNAPYNAVIFGAGNGTLYVLDGTTGGNLGYVDLGDAITTDPFCDLTDTSMRTYVSVPGNRMYALIGASPWWYHQCRGQCFSPSQWEQGVYFGSYDEVTQCVNRLTGEHMWVFPSEGLVQGAPTVGNNGAGAKVFVATGEGYVYCLDPFTGAQIWGKSGFGAVISSCTVHAGKVYFGCLDGMFYCLNGLDGSIIWSYNAGSQIDSKPAIYGGSVYFGTLGGSLFRLDASLGTFHWSTSLGGSVLSPCIYLDRIFAGTTGLSCVNASTGNVIWTYPIVSAGSPATMSGRVYVADGTQMICLDGGYMYGIEDEDPTPVAALSVSGNPCMETSSLLLNLDEACSPSITLYDITGRTAGWMEPGLLPQGLHSLPLAGIQGTGGHMPQGLYICRVEAGGSSVSCPMTWLGGDI